jgi:hypothetical protein
MLACRATADFTKHLLPSAIFMKAHLHQNFPTPKLKYGQFTTVLVHQTFKEEYFYIYEENIMLCNVYYLINHNISEQHWYKRKVYLM